jgi:hypothetical protein
MSDYNAPYTPILSWTLSADVAFTLTVNAVATAITAATDGQFGYASLSGTFPTVVAATDSVAHSMRTAMVTHAQVASATAAYVWTSTVGAGPVARVSIVTTSAISVAPTLAVTGSNAARIGVTSSPVTATPLAALPTTQWAFDFGPVDGFWWPGNVQCWENSAIIRSAYASQAFTNGAGEATSWGRRKDIALVIPGVLGAYVSLARRQSAGYAASAQVATTQPNNLLDSLLDAASESKAIRVYRSVTGYFTGKMLNQEGLQDVRNIQESQAAQDSIAQYIIAFSGVT